MKRAAQPPWTAAACCRFSSPQPAAGVTCHLAGTAKPQRSRRAVEFSFGNGFFAFLRDLRCSAVRSRARKSSSRRFPASRLASPKAAAGCRSPRRLRRSLRPACSLSPVFPSTGTGGGPRGPLSGLLHAGLEGPALKHCLGLAHQEERTGDENGTRARKSGVQRLGKSRVTGMGRRACRQKSRQVPG